MPIVSTSSIRITTLYRIDRPIRAKLIGTTSIRMRSWATRLMMDSSFHMRLSCVANTSAQAMRFRLVGAREFLRFPEEKFPGTWLFGDSGAFSYRDMAEPPYSVEDMIQFYGEAGFTHGCSVDHVIFDFDASVHGSNGGTPEARKRFDITLENAAKFLRAAKPLGNRFTPVGVIQGWSPDSMGIAAKKLQSMGYTYLAAGGMVPLKSPQIHACLQAIRKEIRAEVGLHILGFAKADDIFEFAPHNITSFDTTSPLLRAFKKSGPITFCQDQIARCATTWRYEFPKLWTILH